MIKSASDAMSSPCPVPTRFLDAIPMYRAKDIGKIKICESSQNVSLGYIPALSGIHVSVGVAPGLPCGNAAIRLHSLPPSRDVPIDALGLWRVEIAAKDSWNLGRACETRVDAFEHLHFEPTICHTRRDSGGVYLNGSLSNGTRDQRNLAHSQRVEWCGRS